jgi:hypothetical protein
MASSYSPAIPRRLRALPCAVALLTFLPSPMQAEPDEARSHAHLAGRSGSTAELCRAVEATYEDPTARLVRCELTGTVIPGFRVLEAEGPSLEQSHFLLVDTRFRVFRIVTVLESMDSHDFGDHQERLRVVRAARSHVGHRTLVRIVTAREGTGFDLDDGYEIEDERQRVTLCVDEDEMLRTLRCEVRFGVRRAGARYEIRPANAVDSGLEPTYARTAQHEAWELTATYTITSTGRVMVRREGAEWPDSEDGFGEKPMVMRTLF